MAHWRHKARNQVYEEVGRAALQTAHPVSEETVLVIYRSARGVLWARPEAEFLDGRFELVDGQERRPTMGCTGSPH